MAPSQQQDAQQGQTAIILWSGLVLAGLMAVGLFLWSQAGSAVFFDRISGAIMGCI